MGLLDEAIREHLELKRRHGADPADVARAEREALGPAVRERGSAAPAVEAEPAPRASARAEPAAEPAAPIGDVTSPKPEAPTTRADAPAGIESLELEEPPSRPLDEPVRTSPAASEHPPPAEEAEAAPLEAEAPLDLEAAEADAAPLEAEAPLGAVRPAQPEEPDAPVGAAPPEPEAPAQEPAVDQPTVVFDADEIFADDDGDAFPPARPATPRAGTGGPERHDQGETAPGAQPEPGSAAEGDEGEGEDVLEETPDFLQETPEHDRLWFEQKPPRDFDFDK